MSVGHAVLPAAMVIGLHAGGLAPVVMTGKERLVAVAAAFQGLELGGYQHLAVGIVADIERDDTDGVAGDEETVVGGVVEGKGKDAAQPLDQRRNSVSRSTLGFPLTI